MDERIHELLLAKLRADIEAAVQRRLKHRNDFIELAATLNNVSSHSLSDTTLRRFWGYQEQGKHTATIRTLDTLSRFLGYTNWEEYSVRNIEYVRKDIEKAEAPPTTSETEATPTELPTEEARTEATEHEPLAEDVQPMTTEETPQVTEETPQTAEDTPQATKPKTRKWWATGAAMCMAALAVLVFAQSRDFTDNGITYHVESYLHARVAITSSADSMANRVKVPQEVDHIGRTYSVVAIDDDAFYQHTNITEANLPTTIERIGKRAFKCCDKLETVQMGDNVLSMGDEVFRSCPMLKDVRLSEALHELPEYCFSGDSMALKAIVLPDSIHTIGRDAFGKCKELEIIHMPIALERLERGAFWECRKLKYITLPAKVKSIGAAQFWYCDSLESITILCPTLPSAGSLFEKDRQKSVTLRVPRKQASLYRENPKWKALYIEEID